MAEPVGIDEIKRHLVLDPDDTSEDVDLAGLIMAARRSCELKTRRSLVGESRTIVMSAFPGSSMWLTAIASPAALLDGEKDIVLAGGTVTSPVVNYYDGSGTDTVLDPATYFAALGQVPALLRPRSSWPETENRPDAVRVSYTVVPLGIADLALAKQAIKLIVGHWYANREAVAPDGRAGTMELPMSVSWILQALTSWAID